MKNHGAGSVAELLYERLDLKLSLLFEQLVSDLVTAFSWIFRSQNVFL